MVELNQSKTQNNRWVINLGHISSIHILHTHTRTHAVWITHDNHLNQKIEQQQQRIWFDFFFVEHKLKENVRIKTCCGYCCYYLCVITKYIIQLDDHDDDAMMKKKKTIENLFCLLPASYNEYDVVCNRYSRSYEAIVFAFFFVTPAMSFIMKKIE